MKKIVLITIFAALTFGAGAQGIQKMRSSLELPDGHNRAAIVVKEQPDAAKAISTADHVVNPDKINGYRVSLFRDNNQTAGENARSVKTQFEEHFPGIPVKVAYETPYFKVTAGNYVDRVDAVAMCGKVLSLFPKSVVIQEEILMSDIVAQQKPPSEEEFAKSEVVVE